MSIINNPRFGRPDYSAPIPVLDGPKTFWNLAIPPLNVVEAGTLDCEAFSYVSVWLYDNPNPQRLSFAWSDVLPAPAVGTYTDYLALPDNEIGGVLHLPTRMRYLTISVTDTSGAANTSQGYFWGTNRPSNTPGDLLIGQDRYDFTYTNIPPGITTLEFPVIAPGGVVVTTELSQSYYVIMDYYSAFAEWQRFWQNGTFQASAPASQIIALPFAPVRMGMQNLGTVAATGYASIVPLTPVY